MLVYSYELDEETSRSVFYMFYVYYVFGCGRRRNSTRTYDKYQKNGLQSVQAGADGPRSEGGEVANGGEEMFHCYIVLRGATKRSGTAGQRPGRRGGEGDVGYSI